MPAPEPHEIAEGTHDIYCTCHCRSRWAVAQQPAMPVVGILNPQLLGSVPHFVDAFRRGLAETGYVEGQNVAIEYRWAEDRFDRLPELAADLVHHKVSVIAAPANASALAAKASAIPIVFGVGEDPVKLGLVASLARPGGNATGINFFTGEVVAKRLGLLRELVPAAVRVAVLANPANVATSSALRAVEPAARALGMEAPHPRALIRRFRVSNFAQKPPSERARLSNTRCYRCAEQSSISSLHMAACRPWRSRRKRREQRS